MARIRHLAARPSASLAATYASFGSDLDDFLAGVPTGALYQYTLLDAATGVLIDIYTGKKA